MSETTDILPDSRARETKGCVWRADFGWCVPIFCANCGAPGGLVPESNTTFAFWLCNKCESTHGVPAGLMSVPDEVFWKKVNDEQLEKYGRLLTEQELLDVVAADVTPLATLIKQGRA